MKRFSIRCQEASAVGDYGPAENRHYRGDDAVIALHERSCGPATTSY